jgi:peptidoglycan/LPS O-acetylase OafA/YrhL
LITSITVRERLSGEFSFAGFAQRRVARIMPLSVLVSVSVLLTAFWQYAAQDLGSVAATVSAASMLAANVKFIAQGDYFEMSPDAQPMLHYWSLSLEEQFYLVFPLLLWGLIVPGGDLRRFRRCLVLLAVASFGLCVALTYQRPSWAFYLLPTRAWELLLGSLLAVRGVVAPANGGAQAPLRVWLGLGGLLGVLACYVLLAESRHFPGAVAVLPVVATLAALVSGEVSNGVSRWLGSRPLSWIGTLSFSLYLWHWPVFCFIDYSMFDSSAAPRTWTKLLLLIPLSLASYYGVERPLRRLLGARGRRIVSISVAVTALAAVAGAGIFIRNHQYLAPPAESVASGGIVAGDPRATEFVVVLLGDSKGTALAKALSDWGMAHDARVQLAAVAARDFSPGSDLYEDGLRMIDSIRPQAVVVAGAWMARRFGEDASICKRMVADLAQRCGSVVIVGEPPILPETEFRSRIRSGARLPLREAEDVRRRRLAANDAIREACAPSAVFVGIDDIFEETDGSLRLRLPDGRQLFHDQTHISGWGADLAIARLSPTLLSARRAP